jgi:hypothetical protein
MANMDHGDRLRAVVDIIEDSVVADAKTPALSAGQFTTAWRTRFMRKVNNRSSDPTRDLRR